MKLKHNPERQRLEDFFFNTYLDRLSPDNAFQSIADLIVPIDNFKRPYRCFFYVFGYEMNEEWIIDADDFGYEAPEGLEINTIEYLKERGFDLTQSPVKGDIVCYLQNEGPWYNRKKKAVHWGILDNNNQVLSVFGFGRLLRHNIENVPLSYGDEVIYFRKSVSNIP